MTEQKPERSPSAAREKYRNSWINRSVNGVIGWYLAACASLRERRMSRLDAEWISELASKSGLLINIGSSSLVLDGWVNADLRRDTSARCLAFDATQRWPFESNAARAVNSEHFIEHLTLDGARAYLAEAFRVLEPGGVLRTSTPDLAAICNAYMAHDSKGLAAHREQGWFAPTHAAMLNNYFAGCDHVVVYDLELLTLLLSETGFDQIESLAFGESTHPPLQGIDGHSLGELQGLAMAVEARKPILD